jgi:hypothetical protein
MRRILKARGNRHVGARCVSVPKQGIITIKSDAIAEDQLICALEAGRRIRMKGSVCGDYDAGGV